MGNTGGVRHFSGAGAHHEVADPDIGLSARGNFICFSECHVNFFVGGGQNL